MSARNSQSAIRRESLQNLFSAGVDYADRLPMLQLAFERAAATCAEELRGLVKPAVQLGIERLEGGSAAVMLAAHDGASIVAVLYAPKWDTRLLVSADRGAVFAFVETFLGGDGSEPPCAEVRPFSRIEMRILRILFECIARALAAAFAPIAETPFVVESVVDVVDIEALGRPSSPVVVAGVRIEMLKRGGEILVVVPQAALNPIRPILATAPPGEVVSADPFWSRQIQEGISRTRVAITAVLDEHLTPLEEILQLRVGQVLPLNATLNTLVRVESNGEPLLTCQLGKSNGVYTLRVDGFIDKEQEFMDGLLSG